MKTLLRLLSLRHLTSAPLRSLLTITGVAVGVATLVGVIAVNRSVLASFRSTVDTIAGKADLTVSASRTGFDEAVLETVRATPGVSHASAALSFTAPLAAPAEGVAAYAHEGKALFVLGVDLLDDGFFRDFEGVDQDLGRLGDDLEFLNSTDRLFITERLSHDLGLKVGDPLPLMTPSGAQTFTIHGLITDEGAARAFGGWLAVMFLPSAQEAFGRGVNVDRIDVAVDPSVGLEAVKTTLKERLGPTFDIDVPGRRGDTTENMVRSFQMGLNLGSGIALLVGVFLVYNTVAIGVAQRRREIGTLRALGATRRWIRALFTLEAAVIGAFGAALGLPLGVLLGRVAIAWASDAMSSLYVQVNVQELALSWEEAALGVVLGVVGSALAAYRPAFRASQVHPLESLRRELTTEDEQRIRPGFLVAAAALLVLAWVTARLPEYVENLPIGGYLSVFCLLGVAILLAPAIIRLVRRPLRALAAKLVGFPGRLAAENFARSPGRTAVPVSALSVGVGMSVCIAAFVGSFQRSSYDWIEQTIPADLFITASASLGGVRNQPMEAALGDALEKLEGVQAVDRVRIYPHDLLGLRIYIVALDPALYPLRGEPTYLEGRRPTAEEGARGSVTISENLSRRRNLHVGDGFEMKTPTGVRRYTVAAVIVDFTSDQGAVFMDRPTFMAHFEDTQVDTFELYLKDRTRLEEVRRTVVSRFGDRRDLYVLSNAELREEARRLIDGAFALTFAMQGVAVVLALLGVINTLFAAVLDRTREIGLTRAVGASRAQIRRLFAVEAALIGLTGSLIGVAFGAVMGLVVTHVIGAGATGWSFPFRMPWEMATQMALVSAVCSVLAGFYPAGRAARVDIVEALAYE